jgi:hypothetical protein
MIEPTKTKTPQGAAQKKKSWKETYIVHGFTVVGHNGAQVIDVQRETLFVIKVVEGFLELLEVCCGGGHACCETLGSRRLLLLGC